MPRGRGRVLRGGSGGQLLCGVCGLRGSAAVGHCFMSIYTHSNQQEPLLKVGGGLVKKVNNRVTTMCATSLSSKGHVETVS